MPDECPAGDHLEVTEGDRIVAFLFTDIESSTSHAQRFPAGMRAAHARHDAILREAIESCGGYIFQFVGDGFKAAFDDPAGAIQAAFQAQRALQSLFVDEPSGLLLRVRMAIHAGPTEIRGGEYIGLTPARASRLLEMIHGGQIILTAETVDCVRARLPSGTALQDLGEFRLRDFDHPDRLYQVAHPDLAANFPPPRPTDGVPNNLPHQLSHIIGRERETEEIRQRLISHSLVTLTGAGGCGKTRLALHVADRFLRKFPDGIWLIDLSHSEEPAAVARTAASALGITPDAHRSLTAQICAHLATRRSLLILDNCERLVEAVATFAMTLLHSCRDLRILATSRESLGVGGEALFPVRPLPVPPAEVRDPKALMAYDSVRLFGLRARQKSPAFALSGDNVYTVARICRTLDGIPLAVGLMASWADALTPEQMEQRMKEKDRFKFPVSSGDDRSLPLRHQQLRATIDYSLELLTEAERTLLRRLSIFCGGFTLEAAEAICDGDPVEDVLLSLTRLLRKSLVEAEDTPFGKRYSLLQPIREFALEMLRERDEYQMILGRHRDYFAAWIMTLEPEITNRRRGADAGAAMRQVDRDLENLRSALHSTVDVTTGLRLITGLSWYWRVRGHLAEGIGWAERFLALDESSPSANHALRADARNGAGILYWTLGNLSTARLRFSEALEGFKARNDETNVAKCLSNLGMIAGSQQDFDASERYFAESLALYQKAGDMNRTATVRTNLGALAERRGDYETAISHFREALTLHRDIGNTLSCSHHLFNLASAHGKLQQWHPALEALEECLILRHQLQYSSGLTEGIEQAILILAAQERLEDAAILLGFARALRAHMETPPIPQDVDELAAIEKTLDSRLGSDHLKVQENAGGQLNFASAFRLVFGKDWTERSD